MTTFIKQKDLAARLGVCVRTIIRWREIGLIPFVQPAGGRYVLFDYEDVCAALKNQTTYFKVAVS
jgi:excisionase family DNA binding protein